MYFDELRINSHPQISCEPSQNHCYILWGFYTVRLHYKTTLVSQECFQKLLLHLEAPDSQKISRTQDSMQQPHCVVILK